MNQWALRVDHKVVTSAVLKDHKVVLNVVLKT
jgi:uncharacterized ferritin-like protein (DUF455 family)